MPNNQGRYNEADLVAGIPKDPKYALINSFQSIPADNPDEAAKVIGLSQKLDENESFVQANLPAAQAAAAAPTVEQFEAVSGNAPSASRWLSNPRNMAVSHDDLDNLSATEIGIRALGGAANFMFNHGLPTPPESFDYLAKTAGKVSGFISPAIELGNLNNEYGILNYDKLFGLSTPDTDVREGQILSRMSELETLHKPGGIISEGAKGALEMAPLLVGGAIEGAKLGLPVTAAAMAAGPGASVVAGPAAYAAGNLWYNFKVMAGQEYARLSSEKDENGNPMPENVAKITALVSGAAQAGISLVPIMSILNGIPGGKFLLGRISGRSAAKLISEIGYAPAILETLKGWSKHTMAGSAGMAGMTAVSLGADAIAKASTDQPFTRPSFGEIAENIAKSYVSSIPVMGFLGLPGAFLTGGKGVLDARRSLLEAERVKEHFLELGKTLESSKLAERLPSAHTEVISEIAKDSDASKAYIDLDGYAKDKNVDPVALADELGVGQLYQEAIETGGFVEIPIERLAEKTRLINKNSGVPMWSELADYTKLRDDAYTPKQALERVEQMDADMLSIADEAIKADKTGETEAIRQSIFDKRYNELQSAGRPEKEARATAEVMAKMAVTQAQRVAKLTPEQANMDLASKISGVDDIKVMPSEAEITHALISKARKRLYLEAKSSIGLDPTYSAIEEVRKRIGPNYKRVVERAALEDILSKEHRLILEEIAVTFNHPDTIKEREFTSTDLVELINNSPKREEIIEKMVKEGLESEFGEGINFQLVDSKLGEAKAMIESGVDPDEIHKKTGWKRSGEDLKYSPKTEVISGEKVFYQDARGSYNVSTGEILLSLKNANASTGVHELMHGWTKAVGGYIADGRASEGLANDYRALKRFAGADENERFLTTEQSERIASAFEAYLREGKAPSVELLSAFRRFRAWLVKIYRSVKEIGSGILGEDGISDEIRAVFDRMLASEEEISYAENRLDYTRKLDLTGIAPEVAGKLELLRSQAHNEAVEELTKVQMVELTPENQKAMMKEREKLIKQNTQMFSALPEYHVIERLEKLFGKSYKEVVRNYLEKNMTEEESKAFEIAASLSGYYSGEDMALKIEKVRPLPEEAVIQADNAMKAKYPEFRNTDEIKIRAAELVESEKRLEIMALEREILLSKAIEKTESVEAAKVRKLKAQAEVATAKSKALELLAGKRVTDFRSPLPYFAAERNAAVSVAKAMAQKDFAKAAEWKRKQMLNHALGMASIEIKKRIDRNIKSAFNIFKKKSELYKNQEAAEQIAFLLSRFGFGQHKDFSNGTRSQSLATYIKSEDALFKLTADDASPYVVPDWILNSEESKPFPSMFVSELQEATEAIKNIAHVANLKDRLHTLSRKVTIAQMSGELVNTTASYYGSERIAKHKDSAFDTIRKDLETFGYSLLQVKTVCKILDGFEEAGPWFRALYEPMIKHAEKESKELDAVSKKLISIWDIYTEKEKSEMKNKPLIVPEFGVDKNNPITKETLLCLLANMGNAGNLDRAVSQAPFGFNIPGWNRENQGKVVKDIKDVLARHLDRRDFETIQKVWDLLEEHWAETAALEKRMTGFEPEKVERTPLEFTLKDGTKVYLEGGYYPLMQDKRGKPGVIPEEAGTELERSAIINRVASTNHSFANNRTGGTYSVSLKLDNVTRHLSDVIHNLNFREYVVDWRRLLNDKGIFEGLNRNVGPVGYEYLVDWVKAVGSGSRSEGSVSDGLFNRAFKWANDNAVSSVVLFSMRIGVQNLANPFLYGRAIKGWTYTDSALAALRYGLLDYIPKVAFRVGTVGASKAALKMREEVWNASQFMRDRAHNPEPSIKGYKNVMMIKDKSVREYGSAFLAWTDDIWNIPQWKGAYRKKLLETGNHEESVFFANELVKSAIMTESKYEGAPALRSRSELVRSLTRLYGFWSGQLNRVIREEYPALKHPIKNLPHIAGFVAANMAFIFASAALTRQVPTESDADDEHHIKWFASTVFKNYSNYIPFFRDIAPPLFDAAIGYNNSYYGYRPSIGVGFIDKSQKNARKVIKDIRDLYLTQDTFESAAQIASFAVPYPAALNSLIFNAIDIYNGMDPEWTDFLSRRTKAER